MVKVPTQQKYRIQGQPMVDVPVPHIFQLGNFPNDPDVFRLTNDIFDFVNMEYKDNRYVVLDVSRLNENEPVGHSNIYRRGAVQRALREMGINEFQLLNPVDSEKALKAGKLPNVGSTYEDLAVVVYSTEGANAQLAQHLADQAKGRGGVKFPLVIYGFETVKDGSFSGGLRLDLSDRAIAYHVPILSEETGRFDASDPELVKTGFPGKLGDGSRTLYTAKGGLRRVGRGGDLDLDADGDSLPGSNEAGRVSLVRGEASQNLEARVVELNAERERQRAEVDARFAQAMQIMSGQ